MTEEMVYHITVSFGVVGIAWAIAFALWAICKYPIHRD